MNLQKLNEALEFLKSNLGNGLLSTDIISLIDGLSIMGYNSNPKGAALFTELTSVLTKTLKEAEAPELGRYYIIDLADNKMIIILPFIEYMWGIFIDKNKVSLGLLLNIVLPKIIDNFEEALIE